MRENGTLTIPEPLSAPAPVYAGRHGRNRFSKGKKERGGLLKSVVLPVLLFLIIGALFLYGLGTLDKTTQEERLRSVERAITKSTVQCYAVEGIYPPSLDYLVQNYGLQVDYEKYIIQYDVFASNIMPTILVLPVGFEETDAGGFDDEDWF